MQAMALNLEILFIPNYFSVEKRSQVIINSSTDRTRAPQKRGPVTHALVSNLTEMALTCKLGLTSFFVGKSDKYYIKTVIFSLEKQLMV